MVARQMSPVLKWAGGKTQLLSSITAMAPKIYNRYYEPFVGGGAAWLALAPERAAVNDTNEQLINLYRQMKENARAVVSFVKELDNVTCDGDFYYRVRERYNGKIVSRVLDAECAALMIWINKHCFNGLYRVNGKGLFNVPYNNKAAGKSIDESNVAAIAEYLQKADVSVTCRDFEDACRDVCAGDFVYFDSPYIAVGGASGFTDYTKDGFSLTDHRRLAALFRRLDIAGAKVMLSNNDAPLTHELYSGFKIHSIDVKRMINRDASNRTGREVLITNY